MDIQESVQLAPLTTFGIGGTARFFARVESMDDLFQALAFAKERGLKFFILGGGSNVLIDDKGFDGVVIKIDLKGLEMVSEEATTLFVAAAGESWDEVVKKAIEAKLWGVENLSGIPGSVGGAVVQNIGAYGAALSQVFEWAEVYDREKEMVRTLTREAAAFGYRESIFKREPGRYVVLHACLRLSLASEPNLSYAELKERFATTAPTLPLIREAVLTIRKKKFPDLSKEGTAGSFFKNPVVGEAEAKKLQEIYPEMPVFSLPESEGKKIPLGWILDRVLHLRGFKNGGARLFENQALVIVAAKGTPSQDVKTLATTVQKKVFDACGLTIEREVCVIE